MSYNMGSLNTENYELKKNLSELETIRKQLNEEYTQIKTNRLQSKQHNRHKGGT